MNDQDHKDLQEFRALYIALSTDGRVQTNNEIFNAMLNGCKQPRKVFDALVGFPKEENKE